MENSDLHDYSTLQGRALLFTKRLKLLWIWLGLVLIVLLLFLAFVLGHTTTTIAPNVLKLSAPSASLQQGHYIFEPENEGELFLGLDPSVNKSTLIHLEIRKAIIDLNLLADCLDGATNLRSITIVAQDLTRSSGKRVHLPNLEEFRFNYIPHINADEFKRAEILKDIMLFDTIKDTDWDFRREVLNLKVHILIVIDGTTLLEVNRKVGLININLHFCSEILNYLEGEFKRLSLSWCPFSNVSLVHPSLKYLNLNNAIPRSPSNLSTLIRSLTVLEEFHAFQPYLGQDDEAPEYYWSPASPSLQIPINLSEFPLTMKKLSLCRLSLMSTSIYVSSIEELSLEESIVAPIIINNFAQTFPNITTVRLFSLTTSSKTGWGPKLLLKVLQSNANKIVVTGFKRTGYEDAYIVQVDQILRSYGLATQEENFAVNKSRTGLGSARAMTYLETNYKRFESMGFEDIDTYEDYLMYDAIDSPLPTAGQTSLSKGTP